MPRDRSSETVLKSPKKNVFLTVSEYGEFFHLLSLADLIVAEFSVHPIFVFKLDYGALLPHSQIAEARGFSWVSEKSSQLIFDISELDSTHDEYIPSPMPASPIRSSQQFNLAKSGHHRAFYAVYAISQMLSGVTRLLGLLFLPLLLLAYLIRPVVGAVDTERRKRGIRIFSNPRHSIKRRLRRMEFFFRRFDPVLVISGQDYPLSVTTLAANVAAGRGVETAIIPFSMTPTTKEVAESFSALGINRAQNPFTRRLLQATAGRWLHRYRGRTYMRLPLADIVVSEIHGLTPPQPWTPNSGRGVVLASSRQSIDYCLSAGIAADKLRLTGALWDDKLAGRETSRQDRRARLIREMQLSQTTWQLMQNRDGRRSIKVDPDTLVKDDKKLVILSWPPNQWPRNATGFTTYDDFNRALVDMLASLKHARYANIVISLHPTLTGTEHAKYIRQAGLIVTDADLIDVIDCADIFVATVSSTLMWSLRCGIPCVNFDPYRYQYREFSEAGMLEATTVRQLRHVLLGLVTEESVLSELTERVLASRDYWTTRDGHSRARIIAEIGALMRTGQNRRPALTSVASPIQEKAVVPAISAAPDPNGFTDSTEHREGL